MPTRRSEATVDYFIKDPEVLSCLARLEQKFGKGGERLVISDVLDAQGHQYANLVQKGGGVLGVSLVGYTYILEQMNIRFIRLAGTSAGAINTALMAVIGGDVPTDVPQGTGVGNASSKKTVNGDKTISKSEKILETICKLDFFDLVDGHPAARWLIRNFITNTSFTAKLKRWTTALLIVALALPPLIFISFGLQHLFPAVSTVTRSLFLFTGFFVVIVLGFAAYLNYLAGRLKESGFGVNPGDFFYDWLKERFAENGVHSVSDLISKSSTPVPGLRLREANDGGLDDLNGDVTFITSELVTQNKIEFPRMWRLFRKDIDALQPAGFVRASMSIPVFFESYFIDEIPCTDDAIKKEWLTLGEEDPPSTARFVDGGILSNFPINLFYNPNVLVPRLPSLGIDLDDEKAAADTQLPANAANTDNEGKDANKWSLGGYIYRLFNTVRFYYDKDFLIKNAFFKTGIGTIPLKGYNWLNFFLDDPTKKEMFILGAKSATDFLLNFKWDEYKNARVIMQKSLKQ